MRFSVIILVIIILFGLLLRAYQIGSVPPGLHADEADTGYSAYSLLKTGLTQYGDFNLLALREASGGTHPPLYTYSLMPLISVFGLSITVERLPSVIFGTLSILVFYLLMWELFRDKMISLIGSFFLAISPWGIHISRQGLLEAIALFFVLLGVYLFIKARHKKIYFIFSALFLGLSLHTYDAPKIFVPLFIPVLSFYEWRSIKKSPKLFAASVLIFLFFLASMVYVLFGQRQIGDYDAVSLLDTSTVEELVDNRRQLTNAPLPLSSVFSNKLTLTVHELSAQYFKSFSPNWLFVDGSTANFQLGLGRHGQFYLYQLPLIFIGGYFIARKNKKLGILLLLWVVLSAMPGAITKSGNFEYRNILLLPALAMIISAGLYLVLKNLPRKSLKGLLLKSSIALIILAFFLNYAYIYFYDYSVYASEFWSKQQNESIAFAKAQRGNYTKVYIDGGVDWVNMYAFTNELDPEIFQNEFNSNKFFDGVKVMEIDNMVFGKFYFNNTMLPGLEDNSLIITHGDRLRDLPAKKIFYGPEGVRAVVRAVEYKKGDTDAN